MRVYKRAHVPGASYFFTLTLADRVNNDLLVRNVAHLREAFRITRVQYPFTTEGIVILPDHLHCIWKLPEGDTNFSTRWRLIKARFSVNLPALEPVSTSRARKRERGIWQRRFWEHVIRDERDFRSHMDYLHYNPVKHGHALEVRDWPYSSFHRLVRQGMYPEDWGSSVEPTDLDLD